MKTFIILLKSTFLALLLNACYMGPQVQGTDNVVSKTFDIEGFEILRASHSFKIEVIQSDEYKVEVSYNENFEEYLKVRKEGDALILGLQNGHNYRNQKLHATIHVPYLHTVKLSGASNFKTEKLVADNFTLKTSGASDVRGRFEIENRLHIGASGASHFRLSGTAGSLKVSMSGASDIKGKEMAVAGLTEINCSGASNVSVTANGDIKANLSGASNVNYYGTGNIVSSSTSGASNIRKRE